MPKIQLIELENSVNLLHLELGFPASIPKNSFCTKFRNLDWETGKLRLGAYLNEIEKNNSLKNLSQLYWGIKGLISQNNKEISLNLRFFFCDVDPIIQQEKKLFINQQINYFVTKVKEQLKDSHYIHEDRKFTICSKA